MAAKVTPFDIAKFREVAEVFDLLSAEMYYPLNLRAVMAELSDKDIQELKALAIRAKQARVR